MAKRNSQPQQNANGPTARELIASLSDRIVRLEEEKKTVAGDIRDVYAEGKSLGIDTKALRVVVKRKMETKEEAAKRKETEVLSEIYLASLGMLDGTPLGDAARDFMEKSGPEEKHPPGDGGQGTPPAQEGEGGDDAPAAPSPPRGAFTEEDISAARQRGEADAREGKRIIDNPFVAGDPRRASWDEGHCLATGSDGMSIPDAWKRPPKAKKPAPGDGEEAA